MGYYLVDISYNHSLVWVTKEDLSAEQIERSFCISTDSEGNQCRGVWNENENYILGYFATNTPTVIKTPTATKTIEYDWSPWCIVRTDHRSFMSIQTIDNSENTYNSGYRRLQYDEDRFNLWQSSFTKLQPVTLPTMFTITKEKI